MKYDLKMMILEKINKGEATISKLAGIVGYANPSPLQKFLNSQTREMDNFYGLIKIIKYLFQENEIDIMVDYIKTLDPNSKSARYSLEYLINNRLFDIADDMITKLKNCPNKDSNEWAKMYELNNRVLLDHNSYYHLLYDLYTIRPKSFEMKIFRKMLELHGYYETRKFDLLFQSMNELEENIELIKDDYIRVAYTCRHALILLAVHLHLNNIDTARKYAFMVLNNSTQDSFRSLAYLQLGNSYILENYDIALDYLEKARIYAINLKDNENRLTQVKRSINFLQNYWDKKPEWLDYKSEDISDKHEVAFYYIRGGNIKQALEILDSIDQNSITDYQLGFHFYLRGLINNDIDHFSKSVAHFKISGDKFYRSIPLIELKKLGVNDSILYALSV